MYLTRKYWNQANGIHKRYSKLSGWRCGVIVFICLLYIQGSLHKKTQSTEKAFDEALTQLKRNGPEH